MQHRDVYNPFNSPPPFDGVSGLHRQLGHPVRVTSSGGQAYCVVCLLLWTSQPSQDWYSTDLLDELAVA